MILKESCMTRCALALGITLALAAAGCAETSPPDPTPAEDGGPYNKIDPVVNPLAERGPAPTEGSWQEGSLDGQPALLFGSAGSPILSLVCDGRRGLAVQRHGVPPTANIGMLEISMAGSVSRLALNPLGTETPILRAEVPASDDLLAQLAAANGPIVFRAGEAPPVTVMAEPAIGVFIRRCAQPDAASG